MYNSCVLVGRLVEDVRLVNLPSGQHVSNITLAVQRSFKNENNEYDTDFIPIQIWGMVADIADKYCCKGSLVLIKGRVNVRTSDIQNVKVKNVEIVGERIILLDSKRKTIEKAALEAVENLEADE